METGARPVEGSRVKVDPRRGELIVGRSHVAVQDLRKPLKELGFRLVRIPEAAKSD
jgi:hypothetical protein